MWTVITQWNKINYSTKPKRHWLIVMSSSSNRIESSFHKRRRPATLDVTTSSPSPEKAQRKEEEQHLGSHGDSGRTRWRRSNKAQLAEVRSVSNGPDPERRAGGREESRWHRGLFVRGRRKGQCAGSTCSHGLATANIHSFQMFCQYKNQCVNELYYSTFHLSLSLWKHVVPIMH